MDTVLVNVLSSFTCKWQNDFNIGDGARCNSGTNCNINAFFHFERNGTKSLQGDRFAHFKSIVSVSYLFAIFDTFTKLLEDIMKRCQW